MSSPTWAPPPDEVTQPDQLDPEAFLQIDFLDGERVLRCWKLPRGFLVLTNLRCFRIWQQRRLFEKSEWHTSPNFFFYNLAPPRVLAGRFVELTEEHEETSGTARFLVHDAADVCAEIEAARVTGHAAWEARRVDAQRRLTRSTVAGPPPGTTVVREVVHEVVKVRCNYCGNLMAVTDARCPSCGAAVG